MSQCVNCLEDPCLCGKGGYVVLYHNEIEERVCGIRRMLQLAADDREIVAFQLGSWVLDKLMEQEEGEWL